MSRSSTSTVEPDGRRDRGRGLDGAAQRARDHGASASARPRSARRPPGACARPGVVSGGSARPSRQAGSVGVGLAVAHERRSWRSSRSPAADRCARSSWRAARGGRGRTGRRPTSTRRARRAPRAARPTTPGSSGSSPKRRAQAAATRTASVGRERARQHQPAEDADRHAQQPAAQRAATDRSSPTITTTSSRDREQQRVPERAVPDREVDERAAAARPSAIRR